MNPAVHLYAGLQVHFHVALWKEALEAFYNKLFSKSSFLCLSLDQSELRKVHLNNNTPLQSRLVHLFVYISNM